ncbi:MAG: hypothetical protein IT368_10365 [Candidatus Hydrogenedentes bacterium]|nr:hypothetical protein [Candidatus Hydrogenedentota bacterium]
MIDLNCPHCQRHLYVSEKYLGVTGRCKYCKKPVTILRRVQEKDPVNGTRMRVEGLDRALSRYARRAVKVPEGEEPDVLDSIRAASGLAEPEFRRRLGQFLEHAERAATGDAAPAEEEVEFAAKVEQEHCARCEKALDEKQIVIRGNHYCRSCAMAYLDENIPATTTGFVEGFKITGYLGLAHVEVPFTMDLPPAELETIAIFKKTAREEERLHTFAMRKLKYRALEKGGDAVIGITINVVPGDGSSRALIITGTIVRLEVIQFSTDL